MPSTFVPPHVTVSASVTRPASTLLTVPPTTTSAPVPAGTTTGYGALAAMLGKPRAARAVGLANGSNPIGIVVPCHRVIGASGALTGYAGGVERKKWLLEHEGALR